MQWQRPQPRVKNREIEKETGMVSISKLLSCQLHNTHVCSSRKRPDVQPNTRILEKYQHRVASTQIQRRRYRILSVCVSRSFSTEASGWRRYFTRRASAQFLWDQIMQRRRVTHRRSSRTQLTAVSLNWTESEERLRPESHFHGRQFLLPFTRKVEEFD